MSLLEGSSTEAMEDAATPTCDTAGDGLDTAGDGLDTAGDGLDTAGDGLDTAGDGLDAADGHETPVQRQDCFSGSHRPAEDRNDAGAKNVDTAGHGPLGVSIIHDASKVNHSTSDNRDGLTWWHYLAAEKVHDANRRNSDCEATLPDSRHPAGETRAATVHARDASAASHDLIPYNHSATEHRFGLAGILCYDATRYRHATTTFNSATGNRCGATLNNDGTLNTSDTLNDSGETDRLFIVTEDCDTHGHDYEMCMHTCNNTSGNKCCSVSQTRDATVYTHDTVSKHSAAEETRDGATFDFDSPGYVVTSHLTPGNTCDTPKDGNGDEDNNTWRTRRITKDKTVFSLESTSYAVLTSYTPGSNGSTTGNNHATENTCDFLTCYGIKERSPDAVTLEFGPTRYTCDTDSTHNKTWKLSSESENSDRDASENSTDVAASAFNTHTANHANGNEPDAVENSEMTQTNRGTESLAMNKKPPGYCGSTVDNREMSRENDVNVKGNTFTGGASDSVRYGYNFNRGCYRITEDVQVDSRELHSIRWKFREIVLDTDAIVDSTCHVTRNDRSTVQDVTPENDTTACEKTLILSGKPNRQIGRSLRPQVQKPRVRMYKRSGETIRTISLIRRVQTPFICTVCGLTIEVKSKMVRHLMAHADQQPYTCVLCATAFARMKHLKSHLVRHIEST